MTTVTRAAPRRPSALRRLTVAELRLFVRERVGLIWGAGFPLLLLVILGAVPGFRKPLSPALPGLTILDAYVPILFALVLATLALVAAPSVLAGYREKGILRRLATTPVSPARLLAAQLAVSLGVTAATLAGLTLIARIAYGVPLPRQAGGYLLALVLAAAALFGLGC
jgi:ABC-2 type transport system permease protein